MKNARNWTFFWLDRKQYGWFALFWLAKMPLSACCCWFQSAFLLAYNTHASSLSNFCWLSFLEFEECLNRNFIRWNIFHLIVYLKLQSKIHRLFECNLIPATSYSGDKQVHFSNNQSMIGILTCFDVNSSFRNLRIILSDLHFHNTYHFVKSTSF